LGQPLDLVLSSDKVFNGLYLALGFRLDRYPFPARVVQAELAKAARAAALAKSSQCQGISKRSGPVFPPKGYISPKGRSAFATGRSHAGPGSCHAVER